MSSAPSSFRRAPPPRVATLLLIALSGCASVPPVPQPPAAAPAPARAGPAAAASAPVATAASAPASAPADDPALEQQRFAEWIAAFRESARAAGIDEATLAAAFDGVQLRPRVVELDRAQPEFVRAVWDYIDGVLTPQRVAQGQERLAQFAREAQAASARYGVPAPVLVAVWGIESNYGSNYGDIPTIDALATLGFEGRRADWARRELLVALRILQGGDISRADMKGSWAGAMGQTQFLPSNFVAYAVDADGDGRRDIWFSMADVLASTANFLARVGWRVDEPWGLEVKLPAGFDPSRADPGVRQPASQWALEGVRGIDDAPLPSMADATILQPAGARGPAFLVGANFRAILRYNNATSYALAVGLLSQRIAGGPGVQAAWPRDLVPLTRTQTQDLQAALNARGFDAGTPDGLMGPATRDAVRRWQRSVGEAADGYATLELLQRLQQSP